MKTGDERVGLELKDGKYLHRYALPVEIDSHRHKLWLAKIVAYIPEAEYPLKLEFLPHKRLPDKSRYYDLDEIVKGDFLKTKCIINNKIGTRIFYVAEKSEGFIALDIVSEKELIKSFQETALKRELKRKITDGEFPSLSVEDTLEMLDMLK